MLDVKMSRCDNCAQMFYQLNEMSSNMNIVLRESSTENHDTGSETGRKGLLFDKESGILLWQPKPLQHCQLRNIFMSS